MTQLTTPTPIKRFTLFRVAGKIDTVKERVNLVDVIYYVDFIGTEEGPDGPFSRFQGEFQATNLGTGEVFLSGQAVFPSDLTDAIMRAKTDAAPSISGRSIIYVAPNGEGRPVVGVEHDFAPAQRSVISLLLDVLAKSEDPALEDKPETSPNPPPQGATAGKGAGKAA